ncbi:MAG: esterase-like activity of phytase family protein [Myxococcota bacterium]
MPSPRTSIAALLAALSLSACREPAAPPTEVPPLPRLTLDDPVLRGVSGMALIPNSSEPLQYLVVPERGRHIVPVVLSGSDSDDIEVRSGPAIPMRGVPEGMDTESIAFFRPESDPTQIVLGTETHSPRSTDALLLGEMTPAAFEVRKVVPLDYAAWSMTAEKNRGLEGVCAVEGRIVAVSETLDERNGQRWAPTAIYDVETEEWTYHRVGLETRDGKLSGLSCVGGERGQIVVSAIERHYETMHLIRFVLGDMPDVSSQDLVDLAPGIGANPPNLEGLARAKDGFLLVTDNDNGQVAGLTEAILWRPRAAP